MLFSLKQTILAPRSKALRLTQIKEHSAETTIRNSTNNLNKHRRILLAHRRANLHSKTGTRRMTNIKTHRNSNHNYRISTTTAAVVIAIMVCYSSNFSRCFRILEWDSKKMIFSITMSRIASTIKVVILAKLMVGISKNIIINISNHLDGSK